MAFIIVMTGTHTGDYYELQLETNIIGRSEILPIHILDMRISRRHMKIWFDENKKKYFLEDMASKHGVFINGARIDNSRPLAEGDCITIGQTDLLFTREDITDRDTALSHLRTTDRLEFPTIDMSINATHNLDAGAIYEGGNRFQGFKQWAGSTKLTLAIVFTDIIESTALIHHLGNERMDEMRRAHFARARELTKAHKGYEIKTNGDEFMVAFRAAINALDFALEFHADTGDDHISIRAGMHIGPVTIEEHDVQGAAVTYAARVVSMAADGGIWLSSEIKNHIDQEKAQRHTNLCWQDHPDCTLKGFPGTHLLWSVKTEG